jgi:hypothetical protein
MLLRLLLLVVVLWLLLPSKVLPRWRLLLLLCWRGGRWLPGSSGVAAAACLGCLLLLISSDSASFASPQGSSV